MPKRSFFIGSEWLYYKIYLGPKTSDVLLTETILPLTEELLKKRVISKWFFVRYADPKYHLRIRFLIADSEAIGKVIGHFHKVLEPWVIQDLIWKIQLDSYHRELERYGSNTIELSESIFWIDSIAASKFLCLIEGDQGEKIRWLFGIRSLDNFLDSFNYKLSEKLRLLENLKTIFGKEFGMARPLKKQLDEKYRKERRAIDDFMAFSLDDNPEYLQIDQILSDNREAMEPLAQEILEMEKSTQLHVEKDTLIGSYLHMLMNRLFKSSNRLNEMVCYDFLFRYYRSFAARTK